MKNLQNSFYNQLGSLIRDRRKEKGFTQEVVAEILEINRATFANLEAGEHRILFHHVVELSFLLELDLNAIITLYRKNKLEEQSSIAPGKVKKALKKIREPDI